MKNYIFLFLFCTMLIHTASAHVDLVYPLGGEKFNPGDTINIQWVEVQAHNTENWQLFFSQDNEENWDIINNNIHPDERSYKWVAPDIATNEGRIRVVQNNEMMDYEARSANITISAITGINEISHIIRASIYPNPFSEFASLEFDYMKNEVYTLNILDLLGQTVRTISNITTSKIIIRKEDLMNGVYFYELRSKTGLRALGKFIIQ